MSYAGVVSNILNAVGEEITYKRKTTDPALNTTTLVKSPSYTSYTIKASVRQYSLKQINAGLVDAGDREVRIAAADLSFTPTRSDKVTIASRDYFIKSVITRSPKSEAAIHILTVGGDNA